MKNAVIFIIITSSLLLTGCSSTSSAKEPPSREELSREVQALEAELMKQGQQLKIDTAMAQKMITKAQEFALHFPKDTLAPQFLFQAANISRGIGDFSRSVELWGKAASEFPNYRRAPEALFFQAFTLDSDLGDNGLAQQQYEAFLKRYPKHPIARDVALLLEAIKSGKSAAELVKEFQQAEQEE